MNKKLFWMVAIGYTALVYVLYYVFETALGVFLRQLSFFALGFSILWFFLPPNKRFHSIIFLQKKKRKIPQINLRSLWRIKFSKQN